MVSRLQQHGDGKALVLDNALLEMLHIDADTPLQVQVSGGSLIVTPLGVEGGASETANEIKEIPFLPSSTSYPNPLMREYQALTDIKLRRTITATEAARLEEVRNHIAVIDAQETRPDAWDNQAETLRQELARLRDEVEALPDAFTA